MKNNSTHTQLRFHSLVWPIFIDNFLRMIVLVASYGLMSRISDEMAGILGVTNLYLLIGFTFSECSAQGSSIVLTHYIGAKKEEELSQAYGIMMSLNLALGVILSAIFLYFSSPLLSTFGFSPSILEDGAYYLTLVGSGFCIYSLNYALLSILQAHGFTKYSMSYSFLVNGFSLLLYYTIAILPHSFPISRITLIAFTNLVARCIGMIFLLVTVRGLIPSFQFYQRMPWQKAKQHLFHFLRIGLPNGIEPISYQMFQFALVKIISSISASSLSVRSYLISLTTLFETGVWSLSRGNQIILGHLIGANEDLSVVKQLKKSIKFSLLVSLIFLCFGLLFRHELMQFFSKNESVVHLGAELLFLVAILVLVRNFTLNLQGGLKATGDMRFSFLLSLFGMWVIVIPGAYALTRFFSMGLQGVWLMFIIDELIRVFFLLQRWKGQKWKKFSAAKTDS